MGYYIEDQKDKTKREWLEANCLEKTSYSTPFSWYKDRNCLPVVLINNGFFLAAGIAFNEREFEAFTLVSDPRPKEFYAVDKKILKSVNPHFPDN